MVFGSTEADRPDKAVDLLCPATTSILYISAVCLVLLFPTGHCVHTLRFEMREEEPVGYVVGVLGKNLSDLLNLTFGRHADLSFRTLQDGQAGLFTVDPNNGSILVARRIDREELCPNSEASVVGRTLVVEAFTCQLSFTVNLLRLTGLGSEIVVIIRVLIALEDVDDHCCSFYPTSRQTLRISENRIFSTENAFPLHQPWDLDTGFQHGIDKSTIHLFGKLGEGKTIQLSQFNSPFALVVNETGLAVGPVALYLTVVKALDCEKTAEYKLIVQAKGFNDTSSNATCQLLLTVLVLDANDHSPKFSQSKAVIRIPETTRPSTPVYTLSAFDADVSAEHGQLIYALDPFSPAHIRATFRVDKNNGSVFLNKPLDYRSIQAYELTFIVYNPSSSSSTKLPGSMLQPDSHRKRINLSTGEHLSQHLIDRSTLRVYVLDVNDHAPVISVYNPDGGERISVTEHQGPVDIAIVSAQDGDGEINGRLVCDIDKGSRSNFKMTLLSGIEEQNQSTPFADTLSQGHLDGEYIYKLSAVSTFDREVQSMIAIKIYCHDFGVPQMNSELTVHVLIDDINDNKPTFNLSIWEFTVMEDSDPAREEASYIIGQVTAFDNDDGNNALITYELIPRINEPVQKFKVDNRFGVLRSLGNLDREVKDNYEMILLASDSGFPSQTGTCTIKVIVLDYNDQAPTFEKPVYRFYMQENNDVGVSVATIKATDKDVGTNAQVEFKIAAVYFMDAYTEEEHFVMSTQFGKRVTDSPFQLLSTLDDTLSSYIVQIYATTSIDREFLQTRNKMMHRGKEMLEGFTLWIVGEDQGISKQRGHAIVRMHIKDVNDEAPNFEQPDRNLSVINLSYRQPLGGSFFQVVARDPDAGLNGTVRYRIIESSIVNTRSITFYNNSQKDSTVGKVPAGNHKFFHIDPSTGSVSLRQALEPHLVGTTYSLVIQAEDMGSPWKLTSQVTLMVHVDQSEVDNITLVNTMTNDQAVRSGTDHVLSGDGGAMVDRGELAGEGQSMLNFYIIFAIVLASLVTSLCLMCGIWIALRRRWLFLKLTPTMTGQRWDANDAGIQLESRADLDRDEATVKTQAQSSNGMQAVPTNQNMAENLQVITFHPFAERSRVPASLEAMRSLSGQFQPVSIVYSTNTNTKLCLLHTAKETTSNLTSAGDSGKANSQDITNTVMIPLASEPVWFPSVDLTQAPQATITAIPSTGPANSINLPLIRLVTSPVNYAETANHA